MKDTVLRTCGHVLPNNDMKLPVTAQNTKMCPQGHKRRCGTHRLATKHSRAGIEVSCSGCADLDHSYIGIMRSNPVRGISQ